MKRKVYKMEKLTREECEAQIIDKVLEIRDIAAAYMGRTPTYINASWIINDRNLCRVMFNNEYYGVDKDKPINVYRHIDREGEMVTDND